MADQKPIVLINGQLQQIPTGDTVPITSGGTGANTAGQALTNLGGINATTLVATARKIASLRA